MRGSKALDFVLFSSIGSLRGKTRCESVPDGRFKEVTTAPEREQAGSLHVISLGLQITTLGLRMPVSSKKWLLDVHKTSTVAVERGGRRGHTGTTPNSDVKTECRLMFEILRIERWFPPTRRI